MKRNILSILVIVAVIGLWVRLESKFNQKEAYYKHIDSVLIKADSALIHAQKNIDSANTLLQEINFYL